DRLAILEPIRAVCGCGYFYRVSRLTGGFERRQRVDRVSRAVRHDRARGNPVQMRFLHRVEMHGAAIAHDVERIAIFGNAAGASDYLSGAPEAAGVQQGEVVPELVSIDSDVVVAV